MIAAAIAPLSLGLASPGRTMRPSVMASTAPPRLAPITGRPEAAASSKAMPKPSLVLARRRRRRPRNTAAGRRRYSAGEHHAVPNIGRPRQPLEPGAVAARADDEIGRVGDADLHRGRRADQPVVALVGSAAVSPATVRTMRRPSGPL